MMTKTEAMRRLRTCGTAQNRKVYARHGVRGDLFGVSYANLGKLQREIRVDQDLAEDLWSTGNHDARVLASMIGDPSRVKSRQLDTWVKDVDNYVLADAFSGLVSRSGPARARMEKWTTSKDEWVGTCGWNTLTRLAMFDAHLPDAYLEKYLGLIEETIHASKNRVRHAMNSALIAIGARNPRLEKKALAVAARIGKVEVDHGETGCRTPDAAAYIRKTRQRAARRARP